MAVIFAAHDYLAYRIGDLSPGWHLQRYWKDGGDRLLFKTQCGRIFCSDGQEFDGVCAYDDKILVRKLYYISVRQSYLHPCVATPIEQIQPGDTFLRGACYLAVNMGGLVRHICLVNAVLTYFEPDMIVQKVNVVAQFRQLCLKEECVIE